MLYVVKFSVEFMRRMLLCTNMRGRLEVKSRWEGDASVMRVQQKLAMDITVAQEHQMLDTPDVPRPVKAVYMK